MIFRCVIDISEPEYTKDAAKYKDVKPLYKSFDDDLSEEINWIHAHRNMIVEAACEFIWNIYYKEFIDKMILSKYRFYKLIKRQLNVTTKLVKISQDNVKRCFVEEE